MMTATATATAVDVRGLTKSYPFGALHHRRRPVLHGIDLAIDAGQVCGYLGPNGSGKTTTLKILMGLLRPDAGDATILGFPLAASEWRYRTGYLPEHPYLYDYLTAAEYLDYAARLFSIPAGQRRERVKSLLARVGLERSMHVPMRRFSKGMVQRAGLAQALINDPDLVILDEPMSGLDPLGRRLVRDIILDLRGAGKTVLFSTHILSDAETLCDQVAVLHQGRLLKVGPLSDILQIDITHLEVLVSGVDASRLEGAVRARQPIGERWRLEVENGRLGGLVAAVEQAGGKVLSVQPIRQSLEDYFVQATGSASTGTWAPTD